MQLDRLHLMAIHAKWAGATKSLDEIHDALRARDGMYLDQGRMAAELGLSRVATSDLFESDGDATDFRYSDTGRWMRDLGGLSAAQKVQDEFLDQVGD